MSDKVALTVTFGNEEPLVEFPAEGMTVSLPLSPVGENLYRVEGVPVMVEGAAIGDVIEAVQGEDGRLRFVRVAEAGGRRTFDYILTPGKINSAWVQLLLNALEDRGGHWECVFGGLLFVCLPPVFDIDPTPWVALA